MSRKLRARSAAFGRAAGSAHGLLAFLALAIAMATAAAYAGASPTTATVMAADDTNAAPTAAKPVHADGPMVVALATSSPSIPSRTSPATAPALIMAPAPVTSAPVAPAPAQFFTINEVLAKRSGHASIQLASVNSAQTLTDAVSYSATTPDRSNEPFGLFTFVAPDGLLWSKWRKVQADIRDEEPALTLCLADSKQCSPAAARFSAIINDARNHSGRSKIELVNERINTAIRYMDDYAQWGVVDLWSSPLVTFANGRGDCEDYAIAKYVALRQAGVSTDDLRLLLVRDNAAHADHAVVAARDDGHWLILDNRVQQLLLTANLPHFLPLFVIDQRGVSLFAAPYASRSAPNDQNSAAPAADQGFIAGWELSGGGLSATPYLL